MKNGRKKTIAIILLTLVVLLGGAGVYVAYLLQNAPVPTAPTSTPRAAEWYTASTCNVSFTVPGPGKISCSDKKAYKNISSNTAGVYKLDEPLAAGDKLERGQRFVYVINYANSGADATSSGTITDVLDTRLTYVDGTSNCSFNGTERKVTCTIGQTAVGASANFAFRVQVNDDAAAGDVVNTANVVDSNSCAVTLSVAEPTVSPTTTVTTTVTPSVTTTVTVRPTTTISAGPTATPAATLTASPTAPVLPEAGILNLPGAAAFGGGLLLVVLGILFAL